MRGGGGGGGGFDRENGSLQLERRVRSEPRVCLGGPVPTAIQSLLTAINFLCDHQVAPTPRMSGSLRDTRRLTCVRV